RRRRPRDRPLRPRRRAPGSDPGSGAGDRRPGGASRRRRALRGAGRGRHGGGADRPLVGGLMEAIIRTREVTRRFGDFTAVDRVSIAVARGSIFAFLGANGSGKSTTIRMLIGLLRPTAGAIDVDGIDVIRHPRRLRDRIGYMGQKVSL